MQKTKALFLIFLSINAFANFDIKISFENEPNFKSQFEFIDQVKTIDSITELSLLVNKQDWIESYILNKSPFENSIEIYISSKKPLFILNNIFYVDGALNKFRHSSGKENILRVNGRINDLSQVLKIINFINNSDIKNFNTLNLIQYNHISGWELNINKTVIKLGKNLNDKKFKLFQETLDYLSINNKIPSMIDLRYKDGVALKNG